MKTKLAQGKKKNTAIKSGVRAGSWNGGVGDMMPNVYGALTGNHNEKLVRAKKLAIKSGVRAGLLTANHNEKLVRR